MAKLCIMFLLVALVVAQATARVLPVDMGLILNEQKNIPTFGGMGGIATGLGFGLGMGGLGGLGDVIGAGGFGGLGGGVGSGLGGGASVGDVGANPGNSTDPGAGTVP
ncbi:unnamed protein product [Fraxinus pennsylvanica]|uniref:Glycine-rich protein n=1 Tax=Fraxinus pennsylvanica TaxID=56036 RepID=A0AAD1ZRE5_9LAMI|nr:unnamed protein product [Fraxinus pennsylvanica]